MGIVMTIKGLPAARRKARPRHRRATRNKKAAGLVCSATAVYAIKRRCLRTNLVVETSQAQVSYNKKRK